jgi:peptidoglycan/LPS O-acetylase OafA/YrhL
MWLAGAATAFGAAVAAKVLERLEPRWEGPRPEQREIDIPLPAAEPVIAPEATPELPVVVEAPPRPDLVAAAAAVEPVTRPEEPEEPSRVLVPPASADGHPSPQPSGHVRALDGIRALGVMLVFLFHLNVAGFAAGFIGVDVFFVLSGFLITSLLLTEHKRSGGVSLSGFWSRRARRLLPGLALMLVVVALVTMKTATFSERAHMRGDLVSTTLYAANWHFISTSGYFNSTGVTSPLAHTWSLGIEEQFYVFWPLLLALGAVVIGRIRHSVAVLALAGAAASAIALALLYQPFATDRAYMGTDARIFEPLLGAAAAALVVRPGWRRFLERYGTPLVIIGALGLFGLMFGIRPGASFYFRGGAELVSLFTVMLVAALWVGRGGPIKRILEWGPVAWIGLISYGLYLWHWPFVVWLHAGSDRARTVTKVGAVAATFAVATLSFYLLERPIRTAHGWRLPWPALHLRPGFLRRPLIVLGLVPLVMVSVIGVSMASTSVPPPSKDTPVLLLVGDSVPARLQPVFEQVALPRGWRVVSAAKGACSGTGEVAVAPPPSNEPQSAARGCPDVPAEQDELIRADHPNVVVWWDRWSLSPFEGPGGKLVRSGSHFYWALRELRLDRAVRRLDAGGARVLFIATEPPGLLWKVECAEWCAWRGYLIKHYADIGRRWNNVLEQYATEHPDLATFMSVTDLVCRTDTAPCDDRLNGTPARYDGTHYTAAGAKLVVNAIVRRAAGIIAAQR